MKVFISADIEGTAGITDWTEALKDQAGYSEFRQYMTNEVVAACEGARSAGATEVWVKDAHQTGRNIIIGDLPEYVRIVRSWSGHPHRMMEGIEPGFAAAIYTGYHDKAGGNSNPLAHTFISSVRVSLNGELASEFTINSLCAASVGVPSVFLSGDAGICTDARTLVPGITTVATSQGYGAATHSMSPSRALAEIRAGVETALNRAGADCVPEMPDSFCIDLAFSNSFGAHKASWYPGATLVEPCVARFQTDDWFECLRALRFMVS